MDKRVLLIIGGGIAAYKSLLLIRELAKRGIATRCILTRGGANFVTPLSVGALSGDKVYQDLFDLTDEAEMGHIQLSRSADLVVVAPATANLIASAAHGFATDLATTAMLATDKPVLFAPAMNVRMWESAATQANVETLRRRGFGFVGPDAGDMACGEYGDGRLAEPEAIADAIETALTEPSLSGKRAIVTAGPTREAIDAVRYLSNHSSGRQGFAIARKLAMRGADVTLVAGPCALPAPAGVRRVDVESAAQMAAAVETALPSDIFVGVAAVADWGVAEPAARKLKKGKDGKPEIALVENPDILATVCAHTRRPNLVIGFAAETEDVVDNAVAKRARKGCDWIVANDVSGDVFGGDRNRVHLITEDSVAEWDEASKTEIADRLADRIANALN